MHKLSLMRLMLESGVNRKTLKLQRDKFRDKVCHSDEQSRRFRGVIAVDSVCGRHE